MNSWLARCGLALALFLGIASGRIAQHHPAPANPLAFTLLLEAGVTGRADPLIVTGKAGAADFLSVRFDDAQTARFVYDSWSFPALVSSPVRIDPRVPLRLEVQMPALTARRGDLRAASERVRVRCDGVVVLDVAGQFHARTPEQLFLGENPVGGSTACGPTLHGAITAPDRKVLRGVFGGDTAWRERATDWMTHRTTQPLALLIGCFGLVFGGAALGGRVRNLIHHARRDASQCWFFGAALVVTIAFAALVSRGSFRLFEADEFASFYDFQAVSLLQGRLDVPEEAIGGEAFEADGKLYGYFGPTPALLRLPFVLAGIAFGETSRALMVLSFTGSLLAAWLILREATAPRAPSRFAAVASVVSVGLGSTLFFLGTHSFVFHEAILTGIAFALWSAWCSLHHLRSPGGRWWMGALGCAILSLHARPPTGLFALTLLGCVCVACLRRERNISRHIGIGLLCCAGLASLNALAYLKFRTLDPAPLRLSRPYTDPGRLAAIDSRSFHVANIPFGAYSYVVRPNLRAESGFPWIYLGSPAPGRPFPKAKIDLADHTLALPYAMPGLFLLATLGCVAALVVTPARRTAIAVVWLAVLPMAIALFAAVAIAQRYTGDFCPFLICTAAFGLAAIDRAKAPARTLFNALVAASTLASVAVTVAISVHYQGEQLWSVPDGTRAHYRQFRERVDAFFGRSLVPHR